MSVEAFNYMSLYKYTEMLLGFFFCSLTYCEMLINIHKMFNYVGDVQTASLEAQL